MQHQQMQGVVNDAESRIEKCTVIVCDVEISSDEWEKRGRDWGEDIVVDVGWNKSVDEHIYSRS